MAIDDQLAVLLAQNADLFATYEEWANGQIMLLAGAADDPNSFNEAGGKTGALGYYPVVNVSGQTIYVPCMARLRHIALDGVTDALESSVVSGEGLLHAEGAIGDLLRLNVPASTLDEARAGIRNDVALTPQSGKAAIDQSAASLSERISDAKSNPSLSQANIAAAYAAGVAFPDPVARALANNVVYPSAPANGLDDTATIVDFFARAQGRVAFLPAGTWKVKSLIVSAFNRTVIRGVPGLTTIEGDFDYRVIRMIDSSDATIEDISFRTTYANTTEDATFAVVYCNLNSLRNVRFRRCKFSAPNANTSGFNAFPRSRINNLTDTSVVDGLWLEDCIFEDIGRIAITLMNRGFTAQDRYTAFQKAYVVGCTFKNVGLISQYGFAISLDGVGQIFRVNNNYMENLRDIGIENTGFSHGQVIGNRGSKFGRGWRMLTMNTTDPTAQGAVSCVGSISGTVLTVTSVVGGLAPMCCLAAGTIAANTYIVKQLTGATGGPGTYSVSVPQTVASTAISVTVQISNVEVRDNRMLGDPAGAVPCYFLGMDASCAVSDNYFITTNSLNSGANQGEAVYVKGCYGTRFARETYINADPAGRYALTLTGTAKFCDFADCHFDNSANTSAFATIRFTDSVIRNTVSGRTTIVKPATGPYADQQGSALDNSVAPFDDGTSTIVGNYKTLSLSDADTTLLTEPINYGFIDITGALTAARKLTVGAGMVRSGCRIRNGTNQALQLVLATSAGSVNGDIIAAGASVTAIYSRSAGTVKAA
ncbi:hypothetical protein C8J42_103587 [Sphingomonas sp. PP-CE-1A-559]|uniref:hypothetical protein n=1 Tax=Sphingomonas sp. PP-CE-1A-559 TaxID=2135657 RepID=UPI001055689F|nr:hypothetical protein [Sphingomonas sp. PP-CE-1A-559]TCP91895.1 hypothetical protein C8J42_103587 [Sphingomonas sp. PP-CE-1A-559]